ncbi:MAG: glycosyltransferase [Thermoanaerobaculia bacterium]
MKIRILTAGSRGDIDPFLALAVGLQQAGHEVAMWVPPIFEPRVTKRGIPYAAPQGGGQDFAAIQPSQENALKMLQDDGRQALGEMLEATWLACQDAEALIYHATVISGPHIAEKLGIPRFAAIQPPILTPTGAFPCPLSLKPAGDAAGNRASYREVLDLLAAPVRELVDQWRVDSLGLPPRRPEDHPFLAADGLACPVMYCCSPLLVPRPGDWPENTLATGFWLLPGSPTWQPSFALLDFLAQGPPPVYVGFGSMAGGDAKALADTVVEALAVTGQRGVLASGWGGLEPGSIDSRDVFVVREVPHEWLFPQMAAVVHHGGASTTGAGLRAGKPTVICPFRGDQPFWGRRVHDLGAGPEPIPRHQITAENLAAAIQAAAGDPGMARQAAGLGEQLRREDGVANAVAFIGAHL